MAKELAPIVVIAVSLIVIIAACLNLAPSSAANTYTITVTQTLNGDISPNTSVVTVNDNITFSITPSSGYHISSLVVDNSSVTISSTYTFTKVHSDHSISATFDSDPTPTPSPSPTSTPTLSPSLTPTASPTPSPTPTPTTTPSPTSSPTPNPSPTPTPTPTPTQQPTPSPLPTPTTTPSPTDTPTQIPTPTPTSEPTPAPSPNPTPTFTPVPTTNPAPIVTQTPITTATPTITQTPKPEATSPPKVDQAPTPAPAIHEISIQNMEITSTQTQPGTEISIKVTIRNNGSSYENFSVTLLNGENKIGEQTLQNLPPQTNTDIFFTWNTTGLAPNTYYIEAIASQVENETSPLNNSIEKQITLTANHTPTVETSSLILPIAAATTTGVLSPIGFILYKKKNKTTQKTLVSHNKISSHAQFKEMIGGDIPEGSTILITGNPGSGKSMLSQFLAYQFLNEGKSCIFVAYDGLPSELRKHLQSLNLDMTTFERKQTFAIIDCYSSRANTASLEKYYVEQPFSLTDLSITMSTAMDEVPGKAKVLLVDSATALFTKLDFPKVMRLLQDRSAKIKANGDIFILTLGKETIAPSFTNRLEEAVDGIIELDLAEIQGKMTRRMRIKKLRGQNHLEEWVTFAIDSKIGINFTD